MARGRPEQDAGGTRIPAAGTRLTWRWRWELRRQGRADGRRRQPDPLLARPPVQTGVRDLLQSRLLEQAETVREQCVAEIERCREQTEDLAAHERHLHEQIAEYAADLQRTARLRPDPNAALQRRPVERDASEALVRQRRLREWERTRRQQQGRLRAAQARMDESVRERARLERHIEGLDAFAVASARRLQATFDRAEAIHRRALLRRHPQGTLLRLVIDDAPLRLPDWARSWTA